MPTKVDQQRPHPQTAGTSSPATTSVVTEEPRPQPMTSTSTAGRNSKNQGNSKSAHWDVTVPTDFIKEGYKKEVGPVADASVAHSGAVNAVLAALHSGFLQHLSKSDFESCILDFCIYAADSGSSGKNPFNVTQIYSGTHINFGDIKDTVLRSTAGTITIRRFCAYFAPVVWNWFVANNRAPANWVKKGFTFETKFAAFDYFYAVTSPHTVPAKLERYPDNNEIIANNAVKVWAVFKSRSASGFAVTAAPYTQGRLDSAGPSSSNLRITEL